VNSRRTGRATLEPLPSASTRPKSGAASSPRCIESNRRGILPARRRCHQPFVVAHYVRSVRASVILLVVASAAVAACGGGSPDSADATGPPGSSGAASTTAAPESLPSPTTADATSTTIVVDAVAATDASTTTSTSTTPPTTTTTTTTTTVAPATTAAPTTTTTTVAPMTTTATSAAAGRLDLGAASLVLGTSNEGRPIVAERYGAIGGRRVLVIGVIHGNEDDGVAIIEQLRARALPEAVELWLVESMNPDGQAAQIRQNANGVDLNRNFPHNWGVIGELGDSQYAGITRTPIW